MKTAYEKKLKYKKDGTWGKLRGNRTLQSRRYHEKYKFKVMAYRTVEYAVRTGKLIKPKICESCNSKHKHIIAHHEDYDKHLDIVWLCVDCHNELHGRNKKEEL